MSEYEFFAPIRRMVIKIGSALLVSSQDWSLRQQWMACLASDIVALANATGCEIVIVSSGAIALGRGQLGLGGRSLSLSEKQAAAAAGQIVLSHAWHSALASQGKRSAQMLLTLQDTEQRDRHVNAQATLLQLLKFGVVAVINENDTVTKGDRVGIRYGDNDRLAARIATMIQSDLLLLLGTADGLYSGNPELDSSSRHIGEITSLTPEIMGMAQDKTNMVTSGGMATKLRAAEIVTRAGVDMIIACGLEAYPLRALSGGGRHSLFKALPQSVSARKNWIRGALHPAGEIMIDAGAIRALKHQGRSLLPAGVSQVIGDFAAGDAVHVIDEASVVLAIGLVAYDSHAARKIIGKHSRDIAVILGDNGRTVLIHRDDLVIL